jgi:alpha-1,6-mannosyltransferase
VLSGPELAAAYAAAWVLAAPAVHEALGLTVLEALASGTPVAAARSGAHPELLPEGTGVLAEPLSPPSLADAVVQCLALAAAPATGQRCRDASAPYDWERVLDVTLDRYRALLAR